MFLKIVILIIEHTPVVSVDHMGFPIAVVSLLLPPVRQMNMAVNKKTGLILIHQSVENLEALMRKVSSIVQLISGRMGQKDIKSSFPE